MDKASASGGEVWVSEPKIVGSSPIEDVFFFLSLFISIFLFFTKHVLNKNQILFQMLLKVS